MLDKGNIKSRLYRVMDKVDTKDKDTINNNILIFIKDTNDTEYYFIDDKGNKTPTTQAIINKSIKDSKGKIIKPKSIKIDVVDNSYLEGVMYGSDI